MPNLNVDALVNWFEFRKGKLTYSMNGSRNGNDGTADCSGSVSQALKEAGIPIQGLPSTVYLGKQLADNGFTRISKNQDLNAQRGDIVMMSWGYDMSQSGGAGGHVGVMVNSVDFISVDFSTSGARGQAVNQYPWDSYYGWNRPMYIEVWRFKASEPQMPKPTTPPKLKKVYRAGEVKFIVGCYQIRCDDLVPLDFDWFDNGIPVAMVNWVDKNGGQVKDGADKDFKAGMYFSFELDENYITDSGEGGYYGGWYYRKIIFGQYGGVWLSVWDKNHLINN